MLFWNAFVSNVQLAQSVERGANNGKVLCSRLIRSSFHFLFGLLSLFSSLRIFIALKMLFWNTFVSNGPLAQAAERGANNGKVLCSRPIRSRFSFLFGLLSLFK